MAADNVNIIKLLPPLICGQEEVDYFVGALDDVLKDAHRGKRAALTLTWPRPRRQLAQNNVLVQAGTAM